MSIKLLLLRFNRIYLIYMKSNINSKKVIKQYVNSEKEGNNNIAKDGEK